MSAAPFYRDGAVTLWLGDCLDVLRGMADASLDACVTDPPYGLGTREPTGSTGIAALREGFRFVGVEREPEYIAIAQARIVGDAPLFRRAVASSATDDADATPSEAAE